MVNPVDKFIEWLAGTYRELQEFLAALVLDQLRFIDNMWHSAIYFVVDTIISFMRYIYGLLPPDAGLNFDLAYTAMETIITYMSWLDYFIYMPLFVSLTFIGGVIGTAAGIMRLYRVVIKLVPLP